MDLRRKTRYIDTNFFLQKEDIDSYNLYCQIDNAFVQGGTCSGSYVNGSFKFYPPFAYVGCQCSAIIDEMIEEAGKSDPKYRDIPDGERIPKILNKDFKQKEHFVTDKKQSYTLGKANTPCLFILKNVTRNNAEKPNVWSTMLSVRINVTVTSMPESGEV